jgi:hypothetical protein
LGEIPRLFMRLIWTIWGDVQVSRSQSAVHSAAWADGKSARKRRGSAPEAKARIVARLSRRFALWLADEGFPRRTVCPELGHALATGGGIRIRIPYCSYGGFHVWSEATSATGIWFQKTAAYHGSCGIGANASFRFNENERPIRRFKKCVGNVAV